MLSLRNISKTYGSRRVLDNVSLDVEAGQIVVLLGPSGVGKSTLLRVLCALEVPEDGTLQLDGTALTLGDVIQKHLVGMVFQQFNLFPHLTVERNITLALEKVLGKSTAQAKAIAKDLLTHYGLADKAQQSVSQLSGGQKQRLAIARTVALKPRIICMDEPTSALDPLLTTHVANTISELARAGYIILIASHDTELLKKLSCTIHLMKDGKIIETATSQALQDSPEKFPALRSFVAGNAQ